MSAVLLKLNEDKIILHEKYYIISAFVDVELCDYELL